MRVCVCFGQHATTMHAQVCTVSESGASVWCARTPKNRNACSHRLGLGLGLGFVLSQVRVRVRVRVRVGVTKNYNACSPRLACHYGRQPRLSSGLGSRRY